MLVISFAQSRKGTKNAAEFYFAFLAALHEMHFSLIFNKLLLPQQVFNIIPHSIFENNFHIPGILNVFQRITIYNDQISKFARLNCTEILFNTDGLSR